MASAFVQSSSATASAAGTSLGASFGANVTLHSVLLAMAKVNNTGTTNVTSITDTLGNSWAKVSPSTFATDTANACVSECWICKDSAAGACTATANFNGSQNTTEIIIHEVSGCDNTSPVDGAGGAAWTSTSTPTSPSVTTTFNGDYIFGAATQNSSATGTLTAGTGYTQRESFTTLIGLVAASEDQIQTNAGAITTVFNNSVSSRAGTIHIVALKASGASGGASSGGWVGAGSRRAPAKAGPFDQRGFILSPFQQYSYAASVVVAPTVTILQRKTLGTTGNHVGGRQRRGN